MIYSLIILGEFRQLFQEVLYQTRLQIKMTYLQLNENSCKLCQNLNKLKSEIMYHFLPPLK